MCSSTFLRSFLATQKKYRNENSKKIQHFLLQKSEIKKNTMQPCAAAPLWLVSGSDLPLAVTCVRHEA